MFRLQGFGKVSSNNTLRPFYYKKKRVKKVEDALPFESRRMPADNADVILSVGVRTLRERCDPDRIMMLGFVFYTETTA